MKKTVAALALSASSSAAFALSPMPQATKTICLDVFEDANGLQNSGNCDEARNNEIRGVRILENGCAEGQIALVARKFSNRFDIEIHPCLPPNVVQL